MRRLFLLFCLLTVSYTGYASEQVYFKIAVNENDYSTFLTDRTSTQKSTLYYLATRMREFAFHPEQVNSDYYTLTEKTGIRYFDRHVVQYDIKPLLNDRFHHVLLVDEVRGNVIRKEIYDNNEKLVFAYTSLDADNTEHPELTHTSIPEDMPEAFKGYHVTMDRKLQDGTKHTGFSDGINRFSVFRKKTDIELNDQKRILYGNYVYRKRVGKELFIVVGTLPFGEMELLIENIVKLEEKNR